MNSKQKITIIGAGPAGCFMALLLAQRGFEVDIFERFSEQDIVQRASGRSFNITFFKRGVEALKKAGVFEDLSDFLIPLEGTVVHPTYAEPMFLRYDATNSPYYAIRRASVVDVLLKKTSEYAGITIYFDMSLVTVDRHEKSIVLQNTKTKEYSTVSAGVVLGADGAHSQVRKYVQDGHTANFSQEYESWKYKEISISREMVDTLNLKKKSMHVWSREHAMLASFPNPDFSITAMLALPSFDELRTPEDIEAFVARNFPDLLPNLPDMIYDIQHNPEGRFVSIHMNPWYYGDFIALIGDAVHAALPFQGQGMTAAFEDSLELARLIDIHGTDWNMIFPLYQENRKKHVDILVDVSQKSFGKILRHKRADYEAIYDRVDGVLHQLFPKYWHPPFYLMMSYYHEGFADILAMHKKQRTVATYLGISLAVWSLTRLLQIIDEAPVLYNRIQRIVTQINRTTHAYKI